MEPKSPLALARPRRPAPKAEPASSSHQRKKIRVVLDLQPDTRRKLKARAAQAGFDTLRAFLLHAVSSQGVDISGEPDADA